MAVATLTADIAKTSAPCKAIQGGVTNTVYSEYSLTATLTTGDIIQMLKLPVGARVTRMTLTTNVNIFADAGIVNVGTRDDTTKFIKSVTPSLGLNFDINTGADGRWLNSLSATNQPRYTMVELLVTVGKTGTKSGVISLITDFVIEDPGCAS